MRFRGLDLNLLLALDALLTLCSVSAAARKLHVSQPAMSGALARLRSHFEDPLLVPVGKAMELTALGEMLRPTIQQTLQNVETAISLRASFDPATARRHFSIAASEYTVSTLLMEVIRRAEKRAPGVSIDLLPAEAGQMSERLNRGEIDFAFSVGSFMPPEHPRLEVIYDTFHCLVWNGNRRVQKTLPLEKYLSLGHAVTRYGYDRRPGFENYTLERLGIKRQVQVSCTTPAQLGPLIVGTERVATVPTRMARSQCAVLPLRMFTPPVNLPPLRICMQWHRARDSDGATVWMRDFILETARKLECLPPRDEMGEGTRPTDLSP